MTFPPQSSSATLSLAVYIVRAIRTVDRRKHAAPLIEFIYDYTPSFPRDTAVFCGRFIVPIVNIRFSSPDNRMRRHRRRRRSTDPTRAIIIVVIARGRYGRAIVRR